MIECFYQYVHIPYRMKTYAGFNLATKFRMINFTELNISEVLFLIFCYAEFKFSKFAFSK